MIPNDVIPLSSYVELVQSGVHVANLFLAAGYHLVSVNTTTKPDRMADGGFYVHRRFTYVLGRTADVAHFDLPPRSEAAEEPTN